MGEGKIYKEKVTKEKAEKNKETKAKEKAVKKKTDNGLALKKLRKAIRKAQSAKRYEHTLGVEYTAAALAMRYGANVQDAVLAGLLHDCAKCMSDEKLLNICEKQGIPVTETERQLPFLLHSKVGGFLAENKYGVRNQDIINAILYHTMGRKDMSLLEKIVFVADYIEPGRNRAPYLGELRELAFQDLDKALLQILEGTLLYLKTNGWTIDSRTVETWNYYKANVEHKASANEMK